MSEDVKKYIDSLKKYEHLSENFVFHKIIQGEKAQYGKPEKPFSDSINIILNKSNITHLYIHQIEAINYIRNKKHTVVSTPTASGETFIYI